MEAVKKIEFLQSDFPLAIDPSPSYPFQLKLIRLGFQTLGRVFPNQAAKVAYQLFSTPRRRARHKISDKILEKARLSEMLYGKQLLKIYEWGKGERIILLVHGWESRGTALRSFVPPLLEDGFRVIAFDGPAHGNSGGKRTNLPHFGGAINAVINQVGGVEGIITHSFGGASTVYALSNQEQETPIEKLVLIGTPNQMSDVLQSAMKTMRVPPLANKKFVKIIERILGKPIDLVDTAKAYDQLKVKAALIVHDKKDAIVPFASAKAIFEAWDNSTLVVSSGYGHFRITKNPDLVHRVVDFINNN